MSEELRDKIARIINPIFPWSARDPELTRAGRGRRINTLAKADKIIALIDHLEADGGEWQWVPKQPTEAMLAASEREWDGRMSFRSTGAWQAMLNAAPITPEYPAGEPTPGDPSPAREADDHLSPTEFTSSLADRGEASAAVQLKAHDVVSALPVLGVGR